LSDDGQPWFSRARPLHVNDADSNVTPASDESPVPFPYVRVIALLGIGAMAVALAMSE
jgi:hypothetical protein